MAYLGTLFTGAEAEEGSDYWWLVAGCLWRLYPVEIMDIIKKGYEDRLIFPGIIGYKTFKEALENGKAWCLNLLEKEYRHNRLDDLHKAMSWWHCFHQNDDDDMDVDFFDDQAGMGDPVTPAKGKSGKEKAKSKKKRKQAKASCKKNRR